MVYVLPHLRLKNPEAVDRWQKLVAVASTLPSWRESVTYESSGCDWVVMAERDRRHGDIVWLHKLPGRDIRALDEMSGDDEVSLVSTTYKVHLDKPFIMQNVDVTKLRGEDRQLVKDPFPVRVGRIVRHLHIAFTTDLLKPSVSELDELLDFLARSKGTKFPSVEGEK